MNLLFVHESLGSFGGAEANIFAVAGELKSRGHRIGLFAQRGSGRDENAWQELFGEDIFWLEKDSFSQVATRFQPDLTYVHKWEHLPSLEDIVDMDVPTVRMVHDHDLYCLRSYRYNPLTRNVCHRPAGLYCVVPCLAPLKRNHGGLLPLRWTSYFQKQRELNLSRRFDRIFVATDYMKNELLINRFDSKRIDIIPPTPRTGALARSTFSERNVLVYAGQLIRGKGVDLLLRALARVRNPFEAIVLGDGNHRATCEKLARRLGLSERVSFMGFVSPEKIEGFYTDATAVLVPSVWAEPMGLVGLEAMRRALPVIAFDAGGISAWLTDGDNGFLVPWMNTGRFAQCIDELLADKNKARAMGERGLERVTRDFDFGNYIDRLENSFERLVHNALECA